MIQTIIDLKPCEFFEEFSSAKASSDFIYRGQSNSYFQNEFQEWGIISSFIRSSKFFNIRFNTFLNQQLQENLFKFYYEKNEFVANNNIIHSDLLNKLYFLQHYGIPTCLIDFTYDPEIALYFAISSLQSHTGGAFSAAGFPLHYPDHCYVSVTGINSKMLKENLKLWELSNNMSLHYDNYRFDISDIPKKTVYAGIDTEPLKKLTNHKNYNLNKQESLFILYDNGKHPEYDLLSFLVDLCKQNKIQLKEPLIKTYRIKYNHIYQPQRSKHPNFETVFNQLKQKKKTGAYLFNDIQGLKYDLTFFNEQ